MEKLRKPFQGVVNIIRFNWHFYFVVALICIGCYILQNLVDTKFEIILNTIISVLLLISFTSLAVSMYVYDFSGLYNFKWLPNNSETINLVNINAGFDETSRLLKVKYPNCNLIVLDFYDPIKHTEISIKRARKAYPAYPGTIRTTTKKLPINNNSIEKVFVIFSAHEIRDLNENKLFFAELARILKTNGEIYVVEHLRDLPNFLAYNIGYYHFLGSKTWNNVFSEANLFIKKELKLNPFITYYILSKDAISI